MKSIVHSDKRFARHAIITVMQFASLEAMGESVEKPLEYCDNNVHGTLLLLAWYSKRGLEIMGADACRL